MSEDLSKPESDANRHPYIGILSVSFILVIYFLIINVTDFVEIRQKHIGNGVTLIEIVEETEESNNATIDITCPVSVPSDDTFKLDIKFDARVFRRSGVNTVIHANNTAIGKKAVLTSASFKVEAVQDTITALPETLSWTVKPSDTGDHVLIVDLSQLIRKNATVEATLNGQPQKPFNYTKVKVPVSVYNADGFWNVVGWLVTFIVVPLLLAIAVAFFLNRLGLKS